MRLLQDVQGQGEHLLYLEREMSKDREYLKKVRLTFSLLWARALTLLLQALKQKDDLSWAGPLDDDLFSGSGGGGGAGWVDYDPMV